MDQTNKINQTKPPIRMARLVRSKKENRSFDLEFWAKVGAEGRFLAAWQMVIEARTIKGIKPYEPRLQRSIQNLKRA